jgi:hypothetical protein
MKEQIVSDVGKRNIVLVNDVTPIVALSLALFVVVEDPLRLLSISGVDGFPMFHVLLF